MKIYLSVSNAAEDLELQGKLLKHLAPLCRRGHEIASVQHIRAGDDLRSSRLRLLADAHVILLLLSSDYTAADEMVNEAREAILHERRRGAAVIPVLLRAVSWEHEDYGACAPLPADGRPVTGWQAQDDAFKNIVDGLELVLREQQARSQPAAGADALPPPAAAYDPRYYVDRRKDERTALNRLRSPGAALVLQGPRGFGKATLLSHLLTQTAGRAVRIDLGALLDGEPAALPGLGPFLRRLGEQLLRALLPDRTELLESAFSRRGTDKSRLSWLLEEHLLPLADPLLLCLEQADRLHGQPYEQDFFTLLRGFSETHTGAWRRLRLLVTVSTEPILLDRTDSSGFFAKATSIELPALDRGQVGQMARQYGFAPDDGGLDGVWERTAGHPFLARLWLYEAAMRELLPAEVPEKEVFRGHLKGLRWYLDEHGLWPALQRALSGGEITRDEYGKLYSRGLLLDDDGAYRLRCPVYEEPVRRRWQIRP